MNANQFRLAKFKGFDQDVILNSVGNLHRIGVLKGLVIGFVVAVWITSFFH